MKTKIKFPFVGEFGDYHDISHQKNIFNAIFVDRIKCKEVAFDGKYWGVFYLGRLPTKEKLKKMAIAAGWEKDHYNSYFNLDGNRH